MGGCRSRQIPITPSLLDKPSVPPRRSWTADSALFWAVQYNKTIRLHPKVPIHAVFDGFTLKTQATLEHFGFNPVVIVGIALAMVDAQTGLIERQLLIQWLLVIARLSDADAWCCAHQIDRFYGEHIRKQLKTNHFADLGELCSVPNAALIVGVSDKYSTYITHEAHVISMLFCNYYTNNYTKHQALVHVISSLRISNVDLSIIELTIQYLKLVAFPLLEI